jgi:hypothetical protein
VTTRAGCISQGQRLWQATSQLLSVLPDEEELLPDGEEEPYQVTGDTKQLPPRSCTYTMCTCAADEMEEKISRDE